MSGRAILESLIAGNRDPAALADLGKRRLRLKIPALTEALTGSVHQHHAFLAGVHLDLIDEHTAAIDGITTCIKATIATFHGFRDLICSIPGISTLTADVIIAETGADMTRFATAAHLASWAGTTRATTSPPAKSSPSRTRPGNPYLQGALGAAATACAEIHAPTSVPLSADRLPSRTPEGKRRNPALNAHRHLAHGNERLLYNDRAPDYFNRLHPSEQEAGHLPTRGHGLPTSP